MSPPTQRRGQAFSRAVPTWVMCGEKLQACPQLLCGLRPPPTVPLRSHILGGGLEQGLRE